MMLDAAAPLTYLPYLSLPDAPDANERDGSLLEVARLCSTAWGGHFLALVETVQGDRLIFFFHRQ